MSAEVPQASDEEQAEIDGFTASGDFDSICDAAGRRWGPKAAALLRSHRNPRKGYKDPKKRARHLEKAKFRGLIVHLMNEDKMVLAAAYDKALELWPPSTADVPWDPRERDSVSWDVGRGKFGEFNHLAENISVQVSIRGMLSRKL